MVAEGIARVRRWARFDPIRFLRRRCRSQFCL